MASSINASTTAGVVTTADTSGVLNIQTAGTTAISIDASQAVSFTNSPTVTGGTANGVAYLNGSKVLTTGSALVFDGTNLGLGVTPNANWSTAFKALDIGFTGNSLVGFSASDVGILSGCYYQGGGSAGWKWSTTNSLGASYYEQYNGASIWNISAPTAHTAGNPVTFTQAMTLDASGNLLVGTTSLIGSAYRAEFFREQDCIVSVDCGTPTNDGQSMFMLRSTYSGSTRSAAMGFYRNASAAPNLYVNFKDIGNNDRFVWSDNTGVLRISASGSDLGTTGGTVVGTQTSDERLKTIEPTFPYGLETVNQLVPIKYTLDGKLTPKLGFGAQTTQPVIPEVVYDSGECIDGYDENPDNMMRAIPKSDRTKLMMDNVQIIPVLVKAIQEQQALITQLQADVAALKGA